MTLGELIERIVQWASENTDTGGELHQARALFESRTAPIETNHSDYEPRIAHFLEWFSCEHCPEGRPPMVVAFAASQPQLSHADRRRLAGLLRSQRSLYRVEYAQGPLRVLDLLTGAVFEARTSEENSQLSKGDIFDGRVIGGPSGPELGPGRVFHPASSHAPLLSLVEQARESGVGRTALLDGLLGMRDRLRRFTRVKAEHLYRLEALGSDAFSATWTQPRKLAESPTGQN